jgi:hypothetical protein
MGPVFARWKFSKTIYEKAARELVRRAHGVSFEFSSSRQQDLVMRGRIRSGNRNSVRFSCPLHQGKAAGSIPSISKPNGPKRDRVRWVFRARITPCAFPRGKVGQAALAAVALERLAEHRICKLQIPRVVVGSKPTLTASYNQRFYENIWDLVCLPVAQTTPTM